jgi:hypothetical protein
MSHLRLNDNDFKSDIMSFLALSYGERGSYQEVEDWIREYDIQIEKNIEQILNFVKNIFPKQYITITPSKTGDDVFNINIFGCGIEELRKDCFDQIEEINKRLFNNWYTFLINKKSINVTVNYYPEETKELIKMGTLMEEKVSEFSNLCLEKLNNKEYE